MGNYMVKKRKAKKTKIKRKRTAKKNKPERAPDEDFLPPTFNEFEKPSPHYKFETTPGGQRMLSAPNNSERSLLSFQPYAQRAPGNCTGASSKDQAAFSSG
jgi:hypothetical protein